jgi:hypothetical protein
MTHWCMPACLPRSRTCDPLRPPLEDPALTLRRRLDSLHRPCALTVCPPASIPTPPPPPVAWVRARVGSEASWRAGASRIRQALSLHPPLSCRAAACEFFTAALTKRAWRFTERDKRYPRPRSPTHPYPPPPTPTHPPPPPAHPNPTCPPTRPLHPRSHPTSTPTPPIACPAHSSRLFVWCLRQANAPAAGRHPCPRFRQHVLFLARHQLACDGGRERTDLEAPTRRLTPKPR